MRPYGLFLRGTQIQTRGFDQRLLVQRRLALQTLEVVNLVGRVLVHDEQVRPARARMNPRLNWPITRIFAKSDLRKTRSSAFVAAASPSPNAGPSGSSSSAEAELLGPGTAAASGDDGGGGASASAPPRTPIARRSPVHRRRRSSLARGVFAFGRLFGSGAGPPWKTPSAAPKTSTRPSRRRRAARSVVASKCSSFTSGDKSASASSSP